MSVCHHIECDLPNDCIDSLEHVVDDGDDEVIEMPFIACAVVMHKGSHEGQGTPVSAH